MNEKSISKEEVLANARSLVQEAVDIAGKAGIDPAQLVAPYCEEITTTSADGDGQGANGLEWCGVQVIIDNETRELFEMSKPDEDPEQKPSFLVTQSTANLVRKDFERYKPSLERMAEEWLDQKGPLTTQNKSEES